MKIYSIEYRIDSYPARNKVKRNSAVLSNMQSDIKGASSILVSNVNSLSFKASHGVVNETEILLKEKNEAQYIYNTAQGALKEAENFNYKKALLQCEEKIKREKDGLSFTQMLSSAGSKIEEANYNNLERKKTEIAFTLKYKAVFETAALHAAQRIEEIDKKLGLQNIPNKIVNTQKTAQNPIKPEQIAYKIKTAAFPLEELKEVEKQWKLIPEGEPKRKELGTKFIEMKKQMIEANVSFVEKPKFKYTEASPAEYAKEKIEYVKRAMTPMDVNEASAMDALEVFEKYGGRCEYGHGDSLLSDLTVAVYAAGEKLNGKSVDKIMNKYLDIFNKNARIDGKYTDTRHLTWLLEHHHRKMSAETIIKYVEALKKWAFERSPATVINKFIIEDEFTKKSPEEIKRIKKAYLELEEIVKGMPYKDKAKPNG